MRLRDHKIHANFNNIPKNEFTIKFLVNKLTISVNLRCGLFSRYLMFLVSNIIL